MNAVERPTTGWRVIHGDFVGVAFTGEGARRFGGRFNSPGRAAIYAAETLALAMLECLVHFDRHALQDQFFAYRIELGAAEAEDLWTDRPPDWRNDVERTRRDGDAWLAAGRSPVLRVPSVVLPFDAGEMNLVLNPAHPQYGEVVAGSPLPLKFDPRLIRES